MEIIAALASVTVTAISLLSMWYLTEMDLVAIMMFSGFIFIASGLLITLFIEEKRRITMKSKNYVSLFGVGASDLKLCDKRHNIYSFMLTTKNAFREDAIPVTVYDTMLDSQSIGSTNGKDIMVIGEIRSRKVEKGNKIFIRAKEIKVVTEYSYDDNFVSIECTLKKEPIFKTNKKGLKVCNLLAKIDIDDKRYTCVPVTTFATNAMYASKLNRGDSLKIEGRLQECNKKDGTSFIGISATLVEKL